MLFFPIGSNSSQKIGFLLNLLNITQVEVKK